MTQTGMNNKENDPMQPNLAASAAAFFLLSGAFAASSAPADAQTPPPGISSLTQNAFQKPNTGPPSGSTVFTPASSDNLFVAQILGKPNLTAPQKQAMQTYTTQINQMVEKAYTNYGYEKNDMGVALGGILETCWEISNNSFRVGENETAQEKSKTQAVVRQMQNALLATSAYKAMSDKDKQLGYEACTFLTGHLATQWQQAGSDETKRAVVKQTARQQLQSLFGMGADALTRRPDGTFANRSGSTTTAKTSGAGSHKPARGGTSTSPTVAPATSGPLPAASAHGAQIFVKYVFEATTTRFDQLILFPSGAAFTDLPSKPASSFDEATFRAALKPYDVGTWKQSGSTMTLTFPSKRNDKTVILHKTSKGWRDQSARSAADGPYDTYYPAQPLSPAQLTGAWKTESLTTMGFPGGAAPMVAHGSNGKRVYNANGTFAGGSESFTSATTQNADAGNVGVYGTGSKNGAGRWRLDGPLITIETNGHRTVAPAFILPNWNKTGPPEILIDGDWWQRPEKK